MVISLRERSCAMPESTGTECHCLYNRYVATNLSGSATQPHGVPLTVTYVIDLSQGTRFIFARRILMICLADCALRTRVSRANCFSRPTDLLSGVSTAQ